MSTSGVDTVTAAARRRQRRLRAYLRYARMSVAVALAESTHHTSRGQRFARVGEEGREEHDALRRQRPPPPQPEHFRLYEEEPGGSRPSCLGEPRGPQEEVQQCTVEQLADVVPMVQILDTPGLLGGDGSGGGGAADARRASCRAGHRSAQDLFGPGPQRSAARRPQTAEQWVDVPSEPVYVAMVLAWKVYSRREIRRILSGQGSTASGLGSPEQIGDVPVPQVRRGSGGGLQGSRAGQNLTAADAEQIVDIPARTRGLQGLRPGQDSTAFCGAELVDIPVPSGRGAGGGLHEFSPGQGSRASSSCSRAAEVAFDGGFRTFPGVKKSPGSASQCGDHPLGYFSPSGVVAHSSSWSPAVCGHGTLLGEDDGQGDFFQDGDEEEEEELEMFDESIDRFELSGWRP